MMNRKTILGVVLTGALACGALAVQSFIPAEAGRLSDLIKVPPQLYMPSQLYPSKTATFTLKGKAGSKFWVIVSSQPQGQSLASGLALRVGKIRAQQTGEIPAAGVVEVSIEMPENLLSYGEKEYVEALVWRNEDQSDIQQAEIVGRASDNSIEVAEEVDHGRMMVVPGDPGVSNIFRSLEALNNTQGNDRKRQLVDTGNINRERQIDRNLQATPQPSTNLFGQ